MPYPQGASPLCAILTTPLPSPITHVPHCSCVKKTSIQKDVKLSKRCPAVILWLVETWGPIGGA